VTDKERRTPQCRSVSSLPRHTTQRQRMSVRDRQSRTGRLSADAVVIYLALLVLVESFSCPLAVGFLKYYGSFKTIFLWQPAANAADAVPTVAYRSTTCWSITVYAVGIPHSSERLFRFGLRSFRLQSKDKTTGGRHFVISSQHSIRVRSF